MVRGGPVSAPGPQSGWVPGGWLESTQLCRSVANRMTLKAVMRSVGSTGLATANSRSENSRVRQPAVDHGNAAHPPSKRRGIAMQREISCA